MEISINPEIDFLKKKSNSIIREEVLNCKLFYDLHEAASKRKNYLKIYKPQIDIEGFDIIVEDNNDFARKIQLKTRLSNTNSWKIHRTLLLPGKYNSKDFGFDETLCPTNPGALILIDVSKTKGTDNITYYYTDINIISLIALGYINTNYKIQNRALKFIYDLKDLNHKKISLPKSLTLKLKNADSIIILSGFFCDYDFVNSAWKLNQINYRFGKFINNFKPYDISEEYLLENEIEKKNGIKIHSRIVLDILENI